MLRVPSLRLVPRAFFVSLVDSAVILVASRLGHVSIVVLGCRGNSPCLGNLLQFMRLLLASAFFRKMSFSPAAVTLEVGFIEGLLLISFFLRVRFLPVPSLLT